MLLFTQPTLSWTQAASRARLVVGRHEERTRAAMEEPQAEESDAAEEDLTVVGPGSAGGAMLNGLCFRGRASRLTFLLIILCAGAAVWHGSAYDQRRLEHVFVQYNQGPKKSNLPLLLKAVGGKRKVLEGALKAMGLTFGQPTVAQVRSCMVCGETRGVA